MGKCLCLCLAILLCLCACQGPAPAQTGQEPTVPYQDEQNRLGLVVNGVCRYTVVRPEVASEQVLAAARSVDSHLFVRHGVHIPVHNDFAPVLPLEILVGHTNRPETARVLATLSPGQHAVRRVGDKVVLCGYGDAETALAVEDFLARFVDNAPVATEEAPNLLLLLSPWA